jgi:hypothetical protein
MSNTKAKIQVKNLSVQLRGNLYWIVDVTTGYVYQSRAFTTRSEANAILSMARAVCGA